jgi:uncharacterized damage-inducible protein DinB
MVIERIIAYRENYDKTSGIVADMLEKVRNTTIELISDLSMEQLDYMNENFVNSLAKLSMHICAVEKGYINFFKNTEMSNAEAMYWQPFLSGELIKVGKLNKEFSFYEDLLKQSNYESLEILRNKDDAWLFQILDFGNTKTNRLFYLFHRMEDEMQHQGQMKLIRKLI